MRLRIIYINIMAILLALLCGLGVAQVDDAELGVNGANAPTKSWFPVWDDARGEWTDRDN
ncbi:uncharacterized protein Dvir_GJ26565 [Drosophila virilis]|uniref:Uncharacterized protein n=1 Tax=Drosophila virilis TaxID=7244 RepID=A0A0Q9WIL8_DROVI|nr:uncharacterized protein Dvir_GJ26565 [Drosophila virilis]